MSDESLSPRMNAGIVVFTLTTVIPGMIVGGFMPEADVLPLWGWALLGLVGGAAAGAIAGERRPLLSAVCGAISGPLVAPATVAYVAMRISLSNTFWSVELLIPVLVAAIPGGLLFRLVNGPVED
ncbi:MAG: hypothetical protein R3F61_37690 [Myxococcota bacterium]